MKERPILFSAPMVRAILAGMKTQTRRVIKPPRGYEMPCDPLDDGDIAELLAVCPYGQPGDRLWVRETWGVVSGAWDEAGDRIPWIPDRPAMAVRELPFGRGYYSGHAIYAADGPFEWAGDDDGGGEPRSAWKPSIHMPRSASRITLKVTDVRVERLHEIIEADAVAEGASTPGPFAVYHFMDLWSSINGAKSWNANPWVWVVSFRRLPRRIEADLESGAGASDEATP